MDYHKLIIDVQEGRASADDKARLRQWLLSVDNQEEFENICLLQQAGQDQEVDAALKQSFAFLESKVTAPRRTTVAHYASDILLVIASVILFLFATHKLLEQSPPRWQYDHVPLGQVVTRIESHFDITIQLDSELRSCTFTGMIAEHKAQEAIDIISRASGAAWLRTGRQQYTIKGSGCSKQ